MAQEQLHAPDATFHGSSELDLFVALDCEFVGVGPGGFEHALARVSLVGWHGVELDTFVAVDDVVDYRTWCSGVRPEDLIGAPSFDSIREQVHEIIYGRILIGHAIHNDLQVLDLYHPEDDIRDTQCFAPIQNLVCSSRPSLRSIALCLFREGSFQRGEHDSVEDANMAFRIYRHFAEDWERALGSGYASVWSSMRPGETRSAKRKRRRREAQEARRLAAAASLFTPPASPDNTDVCPALPKVDLSLPLTPPDTPPLSSSSDVGALEEVIDGFGQVSLSESASSSTPASPRWRRVRRGGRRKPAALVA